MNCTLNFYCLFIKPDCLCGFWTGTVSGPSFRAGTFDFIDFYGLDEFNCFCLEARS
jgi:hypothetical protein